MTKDKVNNFLDSIPSFYKIQLIKKFNENNLKIEWINRGALIFYKNEDNKFFVRVFSMKHYNEEILKLKYLISKNLSKWGENGNLWTS